MRFWKQTSAARPTYIFSPQPDITTQQLAVIVAWLSARVVGANWSLEKEALADPEFRKHFTRRDP